MKLLVSYSADVKCKDKQGYTPLHAAAVSGQLDVIKYLLRVVLEVKMSYKDNIVIDNGVNISCTLVNMFDSYIHYYNTSLLLLSAYALLFSSIYYCINSLYIYCT